MIIREIRNRCLCKHCKGLYNDFTLFVKGLYTLAKKKDWYDSQSFSFILLHNLKFIDTGDKSDAGFFEVNLSGGVDESHLCTKMHLWPGFSAPNAS